MYNKFSYISSKSCYTKSDNYFRFYSRYYHFPKQHSTHSKIVCNYITWHCSPCIQIPIVYAQNCPTQRSQPKITGVKVKRRNPSADRTQRFTLIDSPPSAIPSHTTLHTRGELYYIEPSVARAFSALSAGWKGS